MHAADFELHVSLPPDARFGGTMRDLAAHAARYAGCAEKDAERYGAAVETIVVACLERATPGAEVPVILRRGAGPVECLIACDRRFETATNERRITVGWTGEQGTPMCRIALSCDA